MTKNKTLRMVLNSSAALAILVGLTTLLTQTALAQDGQGKQTQQGKSSDGQGAGQAGGGGTQTQAGQNGGANGGGQNAQPGASEEEESDGRGPQYGQPEGDRGGNPAWAQEGIPEVELGRLNVIRSPEQVLSRALDEVVTNFNPDTMTTLYEMSASQFASEVANNWDTVTIIDSPLENLALLQELWTTSKTSLPVDNNLIELSAIFIGVASDKYIPVSTDTVAALAAIVGVQLSDSLIASIASKAEDVRIGVLTGHDE